MSRQEYSKNRMELSKVEIAEILKFAENILASKFPQIREEEFVEVFGTNAVANAIKYRDTTEDNFRRTKNNGNSPESFARGIIFEAMVLDLIQNYWFQDLTILKSSFTDDYKNKVDAILTKENIFSQRAIGVSLDPTTSQDKLTAKRDIIFQKNGLTNIEFFKFGKTKTAMTGVPMVALYLPDEVNTQLLRLWYNVNNPKTPQNIREGLKRTLTNHPAQLDLLGQVIHQLILTQKKLQEKTERDERELVGLGTILQYLNILVPLQISTKDRVRKYMVDRGDEKSVVNQSLINLRGLQKVKEIFI